MSAPESHRPARRLSLEPGPTIDPFALAGADGMVFRTGGQVRVGLGTGMVIDLPDGLASTGDVARATRLLAAVAVEDHPTGAGHRAGPAAVTAFGALPYDRGAPARLVVPELLYAADPDGSEWVTVLSDHPARFPATPDGVRSWLLDRSEGGSGTEPDEGPPAPPRIAPRTSDDAFRSMVADALRSIDRGDLAKVVLARQVDVAMPSPIVIPDLLRRWHRLEPNCAVFSLPAPGGRFVGASPELLVERLGTAVTSRPLAGTAGRHPGIGEGRRSTHLLRSPKDGNEHRLVVEAIEEALAPLCTDLEVPPGPDLVHLHTITHLGTTLVGTLAAGGDGTVPSALQLVAALHPTPAVGGAPRSAADQLIARLEPEPRGQYAGPVGMVDGAGNGTWMVGIRSMTVRGEEARLAAGVGIVAGSDPDAELAETNLKLRSVFEALAPGAAFSTADATSVARSGGLWAGPGRESGRSRAVG